jgi:alkyl sulfatase BDS1-like metallo-beta-lactamase superfamily hydrolase
MSTPLWRSRPTGFEILPATDVRHRAINDFIHLSEGNSNAYLVVTSEGRVVINTGMGFEAPIHRAYFDSVDSGPIRYVILTQGHVDHVGGVDLFREDGTEVVAQAHNRAQQADDARIGAFRARRSYFAFAESIERATRLARQQADRKERPRTHQSRPEPTLTFEDRTDFELGGLRFQLVGVSGAETRDSLLVWLPQHGICFTGNVFGALFGHFPNLVTIRGDRYRDALGYVETLDTLLELDAQMLLVGHHGPVVGREVIREELLRMRAAVLHVHDAVVDGMNAGKDVFTLMREVTLPPQLEVGQGYGTVRWSVRAIWESYAGWFHHRSTTELYGAPPWSISAELVELAGGPDPLAAAALAKAGSDDPLAAIHLAEIVLAGAADHPVAREASLRAHRALLARSENFWETRWLERQIRVLESGAAAD